MKTLNEIQGGIRAQYSSDSKLVPDGAGGYRKVRARRIKVGDIVPDPSMIDAPDVGDNDEEQDKNRVMDLYQKYKKMYSKLSKPIPKPKLTNTPVAKEEFEESVIIEGKGIEDFPYVLILKRLNVRQYPNGMKIGLYFNEKLGKHFSIPYGPGVNGEIQVEETIEESHKSLLLNILNTFYNLNEENQKKMIEMIKNDNTFHQLVDFSIKQGQ